MTDVSTAIEWTFLNIHKYGGDPTNIHLVGQSAGCNLISLALIRQVKIQTKMMSLAQARGQALEHEQVRMCELFRVEEPYPASNKNATWY